MIIRTLALATILLCGSAAYAAAESDHTSKPKSVKVEKDKDDKAKNKDDKAQNKDSVAVSVPDGDPSTALLLAIGVVCFAVYRLSIPSIDQT